MDYFLSMQITFSFAKRFSALWKAMFFLRLTILSSEVRFSKESASKAIINAGELGIGLGGTYHRSSRFQKVDLAILQHHGEGDFQFHDLQS